MRSQLGVCAERPSVVRTCVLDFASRSHVPRVSSAMCDAAPGTRRAPPAAMRTAVRIAMCMMGLVAVWQLTPGCSSGDCTPKDPAHCDGASIVTCRIKTPDCTFSCEYRTSRTACPAARTTCTDGDREGPVCLGPGLVTSCAALDPLPRLVRSISSVDMNRDGVLDLIGLTGGPTPSAAVLFGVGDGSFRDGGGGALPKGDYGPHFLLAGDFDGDGVVDFATDMSSALVVLRGARDGSFTVSGSTPVPDDFAPLGVADVNGDGMADLVGSNMLDPEVFLGAKSGVLVAAVPKPTQKYNVGVTSVNRGALVDVNEDGKVDAVFASSLGLTLHLGDGAGGFRAGTDLRAGKWAYAVAVADLNRDGHADLAVSSFEDGDVGVLLGKGDGTFAYAATDAVAYRSASIAIGDFDGDGNLDLAVADDGDGDTLTVRLGSGDGTFRTATTYRVVREAIALAAAFDVNGDKRSDLVAVTASGAQIVANGCH